MNESCSELYSGKNVDLEGERLINVPVQKLLKTSTALLSMSLELMSETHKHNTIW